VPAGSKNQNALERSGLITHGRTPAHEADDKRAGAKTKSGATPCCSVPPPAGQSSSGSAGLVFWAVVLAVPPPVGHRRFRFQHGAGVSIVIEESCASDELRNPIRD
jgi:hypothetical protein